MTYRQKFFELKKIKNEYVNSTVVKTLLTDDGGFHDFTELIVHFDNELKNENKIDDNLKRVMNGEPLQYVLGYTYFINSNYIVNPDVLIPRQETEQLAIGALVYIVKHFGKDPYISIADIGTGSGILAIYLKENLPTAKIIATDISEKALEVAKKNAKLHNVDIDFRCGDMLSPIKEKLDVIVSNPPYIGGPETVSEQTLKYEPHLALFASPKTKYYEEMIANLKNMSDEALLAFEIGEDMEEELTDLLENEYPGVGYNFEKDMYGKVRFLYILKKKEFDNYA
ncbi:MAG: peptide chain release factor N(5)-glutamine methyltransferase [Bacilli bacterium]|nr:peptide chain release factor N(5)-glutamine methyltransferase [Bacilli bacterium]